MSDKKDKTKLPKRITIPDPIDLSGIFGKPAKEYSFSSFCQEYVIPNMKTTTREEIEAVAAVSEAFLECEAEDTRDLRAPHYDMAIAALPAGPPVIGNGPQGPQTLPAAVWGGMMMRGMYKFFDAFVSAEDVKSSAKSEGKNGALERAKEAVKDDEAVSEAETA